MKLILPKKHKQNLSNPTNHDNLDLTSNLNTLITNGPQGSENFNYLFFQFD